jgi:hypothetical protein
MKSGKPVGEGTKKIRGESVGVKSGSGLLMSRVYCLIKGMNHGKLALYLLVQM